ncbi:Glutathione-dependent formaldehyde-activating family GFA [Lasiodiplodia theobromae]|uniref:Glutathione-dependent formaldehyde-activating enzyme n=1 Tax=Lasiodiplodia theobromae TaxID=45133 RepID=UPI0015C40CBE|nr:Glutathione-dependent formaldehyde-activating enzyme [Lasiodiplodia theobromae]KAF4542900.1 Glutathione-dependent formaldehyde-activating enzyme [Lasiodiplodia theobromae]KAF9633905.1 Glutathione-dependent formaldehyde-activating family GFA [Lasiodiplodia theobromae]
MTDQPTTGGCLCGAIRYSIAASATPIYSVICHCVNCKKATGTHMVTTSIFLEPQFTLTSGTPKAYRDAATDSGTPVFRHFCGDCGSNLYITSPLLEEIRAVCSGTLDDATVKWRPNKEQYIETKSHWLPDLEVVKKEGVVERHPRGPLEQQWNK